MANKIDTGTGGFPTGDNKDLTTYDVGVVQATPPLSAPSWSAGDIVAQGEQGSSDISENTKKTLAQYLSDLTLGKINGSTQVKNVYPIDAPSDENTNIKLVDEKGFPVSATAGQANPANTSHFAGNLQSSYTADLIAATTAGDDPFKIKRGLADDADPDGNKLLLNATTAAGAISPNFKTYTAEILKPNLNNPLDANLTNVVIGDGGNISAANIRPITHTTAFSTDGGTSKNILHPDAAHNLSLKDNVDHLEADTKAKNVYPVDGAIVGDPLIKLVDGKGFPVSATAGQSNPANKSHFTKDLQTSYTADLIAAGAAPTDPFKIKRGLAPGTDPDGNKLLSTAAFSSAEGVIKLTAPLKTYNEELLKHNIESQPNVVIGDGGLVHADNIRPLANTTTFSDDGGTSKNILHNTSNFPRFDLSTLSRLKNSTGNR